MEHSRIALIGFFGRKLAGLFFMIKNSTFVESNTTMSKQVNWGSRANLHKRQRIKAFERRTGVRGRWVRGHVEAMLWHAQAVENWRFNNDVKENELLVLWEDGSRTWESAYRICSTSPELYSRYLIRDLPDPEDREGIVQIPETHFNSLCKA